MGSAMDILPERHCIKYLIDCSTSLIVAKGTPYTKIQRWAFDSDVIIEQASHPL